MQYEHLLGRPFELGRTDCFDLVRDFYRTNFDIHIRNYARPKDWNADEIDIMDMAHEREGFHKVLDWTLKTLQPADVLCIGAGTRKANHFAIYLGGNQILHHKINSMSDVEMLRDFWRKSTCYVLRHPDVHVPVEEKPSVTIQELIDARNRLPVDG